MKNLPESWALTNPLAVAKPIRGVSYKKENIRLSQKSGFTPVFRANNIQENKLVFHDLVFAPDQYIAPEQRLEEHDIVIAMSSGSISVVGKSAQVVGDINASFGAFCGVLRPSKLIEPRYLGNFMQSQAYRNAVADRARGVNINNLKWSHFEEIPFPLAPLLEQKRIVDKLNATLARVETCRERLGRVSPIIERFRKSVLSAAVAGKLTEDWRAQKTGKNVAWQSSTVGKLIQGVESGLSVKCEERPPADGEIGLVKISAVTWGNFNEDESKTLATSAEVSARSKIEVGDFLISRANTVELVGACVIVEKISRELYLSDKVLRLVMPDYLKPWLLYVLRSPFGRQQIETLASGNQLSMRNLAQVNLKSIQVPLPSKDEIVEIVRRVEALFSLADRLKTRVSTAQTTVEKLAPALLGKAFRGELIPQDPSDEPASELLKRLAASVAATPVKLRRSPRAQQVKQDELAFK